MSRRRIASGFNATSSFSLRNCVTEDNKSFQSGAVAPTTAKHVESPPSFKIPQSTSVPLELGASTQVPNLSGISFKFNSNVLSANSIGSNKNNPQGVQVTTQARNGLDRNAFGMPSFQNKQNSNIAINPEIMRLTAQADDLRTRLKSATDRSMFLETQLQRIQKVAIKDRKEFSQHIAAARSELTAVRESESKLKSQVAKTAATLEKKNAFESAVQSAMQSQDLVEEQAKFDDLVKKQASLQESLDSLQARRDEVVAETNAFQQQMEANEKEAREHFDALRSEVETAEKRLTALNEEADSLEAKVEAYTEKSAEAEKEHSMVEEKVSGLKQRLEELTASIAQSSQTLKASEEQAQRFNEHVDALLERKQDLDLRIDQKKACLQRTNGIVVVGDACPVSESGFQIGFPADTEFKRVDDMSSYCSGIPAHFNFDAPISLTGNLTQVSESSMEENDSNTEAMLSAIVGDLKTYLAQASSENDKRGLARSGAASVGATCSSLASPLTEVQVA